MCLPTEHLRRLSAQAGVVRGLLAAKKRGSKAGQLTPLDPVLEREKKCALDTEAALQKHQQREDQLKQDLEASQAFKTTISALQAEDRCVGPLHWAPPRARVPKAVLVGSVFVIFLDIFLKKMDLSNIQFRKSAKYKELKQKDETKKASTPFPRLLYLHVCPF